MERDGEKVRLSAEEARGGSTPHVVRYMLAIGLLLAIVALSAIWITGALNHAAPNKPKHAVTAEEAALTGQ